MTQKRHGNDLADGTLVVGTNSPSNSPRLAQWPTTGSVGPEKRYMGKQNYRMYLVTYTKKSVNV